MSLPILWVGNKLKKQQVTCPGPHMEVMVGQRQTQDHLPPAVQETPV